MSHKFNPGDLALIVGGDHEPLNSGRICTLIALATPDSIICNPKTGVGYMYVGHYVCWLVEGPSIKNDSPDEEDAGLDLIAERHLIPLSDDFYSAGHKADRIVAELSPQGVFFGDLLSEDG